MPEPRKVKYGMTDDRTKEKDEIRNRRCTLILADYEEEKQPCGLMT